ncbi:MAG: crossover junction endodeoxyribonuclease RuvC [Puniceicoccaceae bacterium]
MQACLMPKKSSRAQWGDYVRQGGSSRPQSNTPQIIQAARRGFHGTILGLDPSLRGTGFAVIEHHGGVFRIRACDTLKIHPRESFYHCLASIEEWIEKVLTRYPIEHVACERTIYVQNVRTATTLGGARAAALLPAARRRLPIFEYSPLRIKQAIVGHGRASKEQVNASIAHFLGDLVERGLDESDAAAAAICHAFTHQPEPSSPAIQT